MELVEREKTHSEFVGNVCNLGLLECISSILEQKLVFEHNTNITILFLNWGNFKRKVHVGGEFM